MYLSYAKQLVIIEEMILEHYKFYETVYMVSDFMPDMTQLKQLEEYRDKIIEDMYKIMKSRKHE